MQCWIAVTPNDDAGPTVRPPLAAYSYETDDRSKKQIAAHDLLFLRDQKRLLAVAFVESISIEKREQAVPRCPTCGVAKVEVRKKRDLPYRCFHGHQFAAPVTAAQSTILHTAYFPHQCVRVSAQIEPAELRPFELTNSRHVKLKLSDVAGLCGYVARRDHTVAPLLKSWLRTRTLDLGDADADSLTAHPLAIFDEQERPYQAIRLRRGLGSFRDKLIARYGQRCMVSGCAVLALLEAAHVSRYQGPEDNHPANGLLLRSDLHTLFDLDLIGLNPEGLEFAVHPQLIGSEYEKFAGTRLHLNREKSVDLRAIRARWDEFSRKIIDAKP